MKTVWLQRNGHTRVLVFFAGWGMDERPFRRFTAVGHDVLVCSDYRETALPDAAWQAIRTYAAADVVAWSLGCAVAARALAAGGWPAGDRVAINGTVCPEDETRGIPARWMSATADNLAAGGWRKFVRRMCSEPAALADFEANPPDRDVPGLIAELQVLRQLPAPVRAGFDRAWVGTDDRIILAENQRRCWEHYGVPVVSAKAPHHPFHWWKTWEETLTWRRT